MPARVGTWLRTARHLRPRQLAAQVGHALRRPAAAPVPLVGAPPRLRGAPPPAPFLPGPDHAAFEPAEGALRLLNRRVAFGDTLDWSHTAEGPLWAFHLHQFDWARAPSLAPAARAAVLRDWVERHRAGTGWKAGPLSLRAFAWLKLLITPDALALDEADRAAVEHSLALQLHTLSRRLEVRLLANHYLSNLAALVAGGLAFEGPAADAWLAHAAALRRELGAQVGADGAHVERSPMYHGLMLEHVLDLLNLSGATPGRLGSGVEADLRDVAARMLGALRVWTHPDGEIALVGDSAFGIAPSPARLEAYGDALGVKPRDPARPGVLADGGYVRLAAEDVSLLVSTAGPSPAYQPGHAHGDALAVEVCVGGRRLVTDTGVCEYLPGPRRDRARSTRAHATLEVDGRDQAEFWSAHRVGGRPRVAVTSLEPGRRLEATCAGWATPDTRHRRAIEVSCGAVRWVDTLEGRARPARAALPLAPGVEPRLEGSAATLALGDVQVRLELPEAARWRCERRPYYPEFGRALDRVVLEGELAGSGPWRWRIARSRP